MEHASDIPCLSQSQQHALQTLSKPANAHRLLPQDVQIQEASNRLASKIPIGGYGIEKTTTHLLEDIVAALNGQALSPNYYAFVTGGVTPAARVAETLVSTYDQNVQLHLPETTIATELEDRALKLLLELLDFSVEAWPSHTLTTGATASNIIGLACGREYVVNNAVRSNSKESTSPKTETVGEDGLLAACRAADITDIQVLTSLPHSSLKKASSVIGLGRSCFHTVSRGEDDIAFDLAVLEDHLKRPNTVSIVVISCADVNTGMFATHGFDDVAALRSLCDKYGSWIHVDAAYDSGFFFSRHAELAQQVFLNPNAAYLSSGIPSAGIIPSPLNIGLENSRRFRALPVYATLVSYGRMGYQEMLQRQIRFARHVAFYLQQHQDFELLPRSLVDKASIDRSIYIIVLFRAKDDALNSSLVRRVNTSNRMYVSGTSWEGHQACRIAAANWQVDPEHDSAVVEAVIDKVLTDWRQEGS
ncbi:MAG: hypothetical protein Q9209_002805 [Squamulea sp. 1 TL-2023]